MDPWWRPTNGICCSMNVYGMLALLRGGGDTSTLHGVIKFFALSGDLICKGLYVHWYLTSFILTALNAGEIVFLILFHV